MAMALTEADLLTDETVVTDKKANAVISPEAYGLAPLTSGQRLMPAELKGRETIGGQLHLTNWRLIFKSHALNRAVGTFSILLPAIDEARDVSRLALREVRITAAGRDFPFVLWGTTRFLAMLDRQRQAIGPAELDRMRQAVRAQPELVGQDLSGELGPGAPRARALVVGLVNLMDGRRPSSAGEDGPRP